MIIVALLKP